MNDIKSIEDTYRAYVEIQGQVKERNKARAFEALAAGNITRVGVTFDGCGDSGQLQDVTAFIGEQKAGIPATNIPFDVVLWGSSVWQRAKEIRLSEAIENLCYGKTSGEIWRHVLAFSRCNRARHVLAA